MFVQGDYHHEILKDFYGDDGEKWKEQRKVSSPEFSKREKAENIMSRFWHYSSTNPKYPHVQEKLAEEIKETTNTKGGSGTISDFAANLKEEAVDKMHYLHAVLSETIRLYPAIPVDKFARRTL
uniref:Uncharacterized protein n=1 Tax=Solanum lycopersicum TaxID=4081 RepID=A0A3Q7J6J2_SOLLC